MLAIAIIKPFHIRVETKMEIVFIKTYPHFLKEMFRLSIFAHLIII